MSIALQTPDNGVTATEFAVACAVFRFTDNALGRTFGDAEYERRHGAGEKRYPSAYLPEIAARAKRSLRSVSRAMKSLAAKGWWKVAATGRALVITWTSKWKTVYEQQRRGSVPRTRIPEINSHAAPSAARPSAPASSPAPAPAPVELPAELEQLPGVLDAGEVMEIVRSEHQRAVLLKHPRKTSSLVPTSREVMQWALIVGAMAISADDTRSDAVRRGVALGMRKYVELEGHRSRTHGTLVEEAHPGRWLVHYLPQLENLVRDHYAPPAAHGAPPVAPAFAATEQREIARAAKRREVARALAAGAR